MHASEGWSMPNLVRGTRSLEYNSPFTVSVALPGR